MTNSDRKNRIIARGEGSNHAHVITGDAIVTNNRGEILIEVGNAGAVLKHILESEWMNGTEKWTGEHADINLTDLPDQVRHGDVMLQRTGERQYKYIQQMVFDPLTRRIEAARD